MAGWRYLTDDELLDRLLDVPVKAENAIGLVRRRETVNGIIVLDRLFGNDVDDLPADD